MEVKYNAMLIKSWLIEQLSPMGWSTLVSRALPELLEVNGRFSAYNIHKNTLWGSGEIFVLRWYLKKMYDLEFPAKLLDDAVMMDVGFWELHGISFFDRGKKSPFNIKAAFKNLLNIT